MTRTRTNRLILIVLALMLITPLAAQAHVKWFVDFSFADEPRSLAEAVMPLFLGLTVLSMVAIGSLVLVDRFLSAQPWYQKINDWLEARSVYSLDIIRLGLAATLLLSWQADTMLMPDLRIDDTPIVGWLQFFLILLLIFRQTVPLAGVGTLLLFGYGVVRFGGFWMLDYALFVGIGIYLLVSNTRQERIRGLGLPALYLTVGFSLCWVALEKLIYPDWGLYILSQNPQLTLGLDTQFFLTSAAFVEFALGYLLIICLLGRPISALVTLVFFLTTTQFGRLEIIGHTIIHAALLVFILEGPGKVYLPPILFHRQLGLRVAFAAVNFALLLAVLIVPYSLNAIRAYDAAVQGALFWGGPLLQTILRL
jgi:hypothetical protein